MNKLQIILAAVAFAAIGILLYADPPAITDVASFESRIDTVITTCDTVGTTTSQTLFSTRKIKNMRGYNYALVNKTITGTNAANAELIISVLCYNSSGTLLATHVIDTIEAAASQTFRIPFHYQCVGDNYTIMLTGGAANGAEVITNGFTLFGYRTFDWNK
jgi:hypothetical protein